MTANDLLRFLLELAGLWGLGAGGWVAGEGLWQWVLAIGLPLAAAVLWGTFRVPDDPGPAPVPVPGWIRLLLEGAVLGGGALGLWYAYGGWAGGGYTAAVVFHYLMSGPRLRWMLQQ